MDRAQAALRKRIRAQAWLRTLPPAGGPVELQIVGPGGEIVPVLLERDGS